MSNPIPDLEQVAKAHRLIREGTYLDRLLLQPQLGVLKKAFVHEVAYCIFTRLRKRESSLLVDYGELFNRGEYPQTDGWNIMEKVYRRLNPETVPIPAPEYQI